MLVWTFTVSLSILGAVADTDNAINPLPSYVPGNNRTGTWSGAKLGGILVGIAIASMTILIIWGKIMGHQYLNRPKRFLRYMKVKRAKRKAMRNSEPFDDPEEERPVRGRSRVEVLPDPGLPPPTYQKPVREV